ncbi:MAG: LptF/LptG family permease, partial [Nitrospinota bacterium]
SRSREVMVIMSCGFSALRISAPVLGAALAASFLLMLNVEYLMPASWTESSRIFREDIRNIKSVSADRRNFIWLKTGTGKIWNIALMDAAAGTLNGVTVIEFSPGWRKFASITTAAKAYKEKGEWVFLDGIQRTFPRDGGFEEDLFSKRSFAFDMDFEDLKQVQRKPQEMSLKEINAHIKRVREAGYDDTRYVVDMYSKILFPLTTVVMAFIAVPFGLKPRRTEGVLMGIAAAVFIGFLFWFIFSMGLSLGYSGKLPPALAAGGAHLLFLLAGSYAMISRSYLRAGLFGRFRGWRA